MTNRLMFFTLLRDNFREDKAHLYMNFRFRHLWRRDYVINYNIGPA